jgi:hypothetical protein
MGWEPLAHHDEPAVAGELDPSRIRSAPAGGIVVTSMVRYHLMPLANPSRARAGEAAPSGPKAGALAQAAAGKRARRSGSAAGCLEPVEKVVTQPRVGESARTGQVLWVVVQSVR